ncbi:MAG TPA: SUMF1/EgtB/PvdO family nonheme iron enzyme [Planctomycetota bacterium]|nr:SUMF1/EgtB/PvdO family nonheme iron enzyme [Planctomycetota bacterium]
MDDELRRLIRARDLSPEDAGSARRVATLAARRGDRLFATNAWQEVLRRSPRDEEAERRLAELGCDLTFVGVDAQGLDEYRNAVDGTVLVRSPALPGIFVARHPVSYEQFHRFLAREGSRPEVKKWIGGHGPLRRTSLANVWSLRGEQSESYVQEVSWLGANAYATWAGGRLLEAIEWLRLAEAPAAFEGFDRTEGEWVAGENEHGQRPIATLWDPRWPVAASHHMRWANADIVGELVLFRYARDSWFRNDLR